VYSCVGLSGEGSACRRKNMRLPVAVAAAAVGAAAAYRRLHPEDDLAGEVAVVTGASRGLGLLHLATELARSPLGD
jgi:hypothetical protein